jgi:hypothetical protein
MWGMGRPAKFTADEYRRLVKAIATAMMSVNVLEDSLSNDPEWRNAGIANTIGKPLVEIATILQIDPSDLSEELRLLVKSYPSK